MKLHDVISIHPDLKGGTPVFRNTRIPITTFLTYLRQGDSIDEFVRDYEIDRRAVRDFILYLETEFGGPGYEPLPFEREFAHESNT